MPTIQYTPAQRAAVDFSGGNLLLSAAAGSGKTAALTGRICRLIADGEAGIGDMLIVTYTRAAAAEMRARIEKRLGDMIEEARSAGDPLLLSRASRAVCELPGAKISTIHSFLYQSLRPYLPALGHSPDARILDEKTVEGIRAEIMRDTVDDAFSGSGGPGQGEEDTVSFEALADVVGQTRNAEALDEELLRLDKRLRATVGTGVNGSDAAADALNRFADLLDGVREEDFLSSPYGAEIRARVADFAAHYARVFRGFADEYASFEEVVKKYGAILGDHTAWAERTEALARAPETTFDELKAAFSGLQFDRLPSRTKAIPTEAADALKFFREEMKKNAKNIMRDCFSSDAAEAVRGARTTAVVLRRLALVLADFSARLDRRKREMAALDYGDLETCALRLLIDENGKRSRAAEEIGGAFRYIFIDEYQDTNEVQDAVFRAIAPTAARFMVGDIKQSIYRFRGADPGVFSRYRARWCSISPEESGAVPAKTGDEGYSLFMSENFRSASPVVALVNAVSNYCLPFGGIPFGEEDLLIHAKNDGEKTPPDAEIVLIEKKRRKGGEEDGEDVDPGDPEIEYVADRAASLIGRYDYRGEKIVKPSDVAILLRSNRNAPLYRDALERRGIPATVKISRPLGSYPSVMLLVCLLNFADNPLRDAYAAGALRSPVFSVDVGGLIAIRQAAGEMPLYVGVRALAESAEESPLVSACRRVRDWIGAQKTVSRGLRADEYIEYLLRDLDFFSMDGIRENGAERDAVNRFCTLAKDYENGVGGRSGGISGFLEGLRELLDAAEEAGGGGKAKTEAVSILSIHASKGLQFPVCFVSECAKRRNSDDEKRTVLYDRELGLGMTLPDPGGLARCDTLIRRTVAMKTARESVNEEMRMLYVALTRAGDHLIVTAKREKPDDFLKESERQAAYADGWRVHGAGDYITWILEALAAHPIRSARVSVVYANGEREEDAPPDVPSSEPSGSGGFDGSAGARETAPVPVTASDKDEEADAAADYEARFAFRYGEDGLVRIPSKLTVSRLYPEILDGEGGGLTPSLDTPPDPTGGAALPSDLNGEADAPHPAVLEAGGMDGPGGGPDAAEKTGTEPPAPRRPAFMTGGKQATAADRGSATHVFLQFVNYEKLRENGVRAEIDRLRRERYLSDSMAELIYVRQIERFRESALLDALLRSPMVKREFRFNVLLPAERFTADPMLAEKLRAKGVRITVQGVVDCVYRDPDTNRLVLVDYKTDALSAEEFRNAEKAEEKLIRRHRDQLRYYREICADMFGEPMERTVIYSTVLGRCVEIPRD